LPSPAEADAWARALASVPSSGSADVALPVDYATRYCCLAYARNDGVRSKVTELFSKTTGQLEALELQLRSSDDFRAGSHLVAYIYRLGHGGAGVVMAFKGSTLNAQDWSHNLHIVTRKGTKAAENHKGAVHWGVHLFPDAGALASGGGEAAEAQVFTGFVKYWMKLDRQSLECSLEPWREVLESWGAPLPSDAGSFRAWLHSGAWKWCAVVGHSLGGAMAQIAATDLAVRSGRSVLLATLAAPSAGNTAFVRLGNQHLMPSGGLEVANSGDTVPLMGYHGFKVMNAQKFHGGCRVELPAHLWQAVFDPYHVHLSYGISSTAASGGDARRPVLFRFPGMTYKPSATHDNMTCTLGSYWARRSEDALELAASPAQQTQA